MKKVYSSKEITKQLKEFCKNPLKDTKNVFTISLLSRVKNNGI